MTNVYRIAPASVRDFSRAGGLNVYETFDEARVACEALMRAHPLDGDTWAVYEAPDPAKRGRGRPRLPPDGAGKRSRRATGMLPLDWRPELRDALAAFYGHVVAFQC